MATINEDNTTHMQYSGGTYSTPDNRGFIEFNVETKEWDAWHEWAEGITSRHDNFEDAVQFAFYADGRVGYDDDKQAYRIEE